METPYVIVVKESHHRSRSHGQGVQSLHITARIHDCFLIFPSAHAEHAHAGTSAEAADWMHCS